MKRLLIAAVAALALAAPAARAATYTYTSTAAQEAIITDARARANASIPATVCSGSPQVCVANPNLRADNVAFIGALLLNAINSWDQTAVHAPTTVAEKNLVLNLLAADIARGDANSATATVLRDRILANQ